MSDAATPPFPATEHTSTRNTSVVLDFDDAGDFERAQQGLVATIGDRRITRGDAVIRDLATHDFVREGDDAPDTVHPGLWRQAKLNSVHGLFEVADGVWQARGYDMSNITFLAGDDGWLIIDPLTTTESAAACLKLANDALGERPVTSIIYTHSHVDHYGGVLGVTSPEAVAAGDVRIVAPDGFMHEVVSESAIAGPIMARRAMYQFGPLLAPGPMGQVDCGLGQALPLGQAALIAPTDTITETGQEMTLSGIRVVFQNTPDAEAPAEMNFHFPEKRLLCMAENCTHTIHNLYPIRGAQTRDSLAWSKYIHEALELWGNDSDVLFASHHWPRFGPDDVRGFLELQRDVYRWMHDQTMRLANHGRVPTEIADELTLPSCFTESHVQGYYGTVSHNVRSVYNRYLGWYDGNPANLNPLPPVESGERYVEFMGGADEVLRRAQVVFDEGDYRWVAQVVNHVIFADPTNEDARALQARAFEQLGYQSESGTWRNAYLMGAQELRQGALQMPLRAGRRQGDAMEAEHLFDVMGVRFDPSRFGRGSATINWHFTDLGEHHVMGVANATIHHSPDTTDDAADVSISLVRELVYPLAEDEGAFDAAIDAGTVEVSGDVAVLREFFDALDEFHASPIVEP